MGPITCLACLVIGSLSAVTARDPLIIETSIFVEKSGFEKLKTVTEKSSASDVDNDVRGILFEVNEILNSLKHFDVQLQIKDLKYLPYDVTSADDQGRVMYKAARSSFGSWLKTHGSKGRDLSILATGKQLNGTEGDKSKDILCHSQPYQVVGITGAFTDVFEITRAIAETLGVDADGQGEAKACDGQAGYVMSPVLVADTQNHFSFSLCSAKMIRARYSLLSKKGKNCLTDGMEKSPAIGKGPRFASTLRSPDELCSRQFGPRSLIMRWKYQSYGDDVCTQVVCAVSAVGSGWDEGQARPVPTPPGFSCGKNKHCVHGKCVQGGGSPSTKVPVSDECAFGDAPPRHVLVNGTCGDAAPAQCMNWHRDCCMSCANYADSQPLVDTKPDVEYPSDARMTADDVCRFHFGPASSLARNVYDSYGNKLCSRLTCITKWAGKEITTSTLTGLAPEGMECDLNSQCRQGICEETLEGNPSISDSCPVGDLEWLAGNIQNKCHVIRNLGQCAGMERLCCVSCGPL